MVWPLSVYSVSHSGSSSSTKHPAWCKQLQAATALITGKSAVKGSEKTRFGSKPSSAVWGGCSKLGWAPLYRAGAIPVVFSP